jgi:hypothetical protein
VVDEVAIAERYELLSVQRVLDERSRRLWAASEARSAGRGGIAAVVRATGISESTVRRGLEDLELGEPLEPGRVRRPGGGRKPVTETNPTILKDLERLVDPVTRGDPESPLRWTSKSAAKLAVALQEMGHEVVDRTTLRLLKRLGYRLQSNAKTQEGAAHPDRDAQFAHINQTAETAVAAGQPVISVDTKKKELLGNYKAVGREFEPGGEPVKVQTHDFPDPSVPKAVPYGVYDIANNEGYVSVGISGDTAQFSVASIRAWWEHLGKKRFPHAKTLTITADCGGSNNPRVRLWKTELQRLADDTGLMLEVCHFPPGTSKWNKVEHRLFSVISMNWRGRPLESYQVIIDLITSAKTSTGLKIYARLDEGHYPTKIKITDEQIAAIKITGHDFHPEWNYLIQPSTIKS